MGNRILGFIVLFSLLLSVTTDSAAGMHRHQQVENELSSFAEHHIYELSSASFNADQSEKNATLAHLSNGKIHSINCVKVSNAVFLSGYSFYPEKSVGYVIAPSFFYSTHLHNFLQSLLFPKHSFW